MLLLQGSLPIRKAGPGQENPQEGMERPKPGGSLWRTTHCQATLLDVETCGELLSSHGFWEGLLWRMQ